VAGKLIRQSLKLDLLSIAKLRLADFEKYEREAVETCNTASKGRMNFGDGVALFKTQTNDSNLLKPSAKLRRIEAINNSTQEAMNMVRPYFSRQVFMV
jgi:hypothetical protein